MFDKVFSGKLAAKTEIIEKWMKMDGKKMMLAWQMAPCVLR